MKNKTKANRFSVSEQILESVRFAHIRRVNPHAPGQTELYATVATLPVSETHSVVRIAIKANGDQASRAIGRKIALGRAERCLADFRENAEAFVSTNVYDVLPNEKICQLVRSIKGDPDSIKRALAEFRCQNPDSVALTDLISA